MARKIRVSYEDINLIETKKSKVSNFKKNINNILKSKKLSKIQIGIMISSFLVIFFGVYFIFFFGPSIEKVKESVVMIETYDANGELLGTGSGFCAFKSNLIVTNFHVIEGAHEIKIVTNDKERHSAFKIAVFDYNNDLAILNTNVSLSPLEFGSDSEIKTGKKIKTIGSPLGELNTLSTGIISNADNDKGIQISAPISHGSSGGVLLNNRNKVIGITYAGYDIGQSLNFSINAKLLKDLYKKYQNSEYKNISIDGSGDSVSYTLCYNHNNDLKFNGCLYGNNGIYSTESIDVLYKLTDTFTVYDYIESKKIDPTLYNSLDNSEKKLAAKLFLEINDKASLYNSDLNGMNIIDLMLAVSKAEKNIFNKASLANAVASIKEIENNSKCFNKVNEMNMNIPEKRLLLLGICPSFSPRDLSNSDAQGFVDDINSLNLSVSEKSTILRRFGYTVNDGNVNW